MTNALRTFLSSIINIYTDRIKNPFFGAFFFSWVACNWSSILILLFSDFSIETKIGGIKSESGLLLGFIIPLLSALFMSWFFPSISDWIIARQSKPILKSMRRYSIRKESSLLRKIKTEKLRAKADAAYEREMSNQELEIQKILEKIKESQGIILEKDNEIKELKLNQAELKKSFERESAQCEYYKRNYETGMAAEKNIYEKYSNLFQGNEAGVIMVRDGMDSHLKELDLKLKMSKL